jgi:hypothetical protein
VIDVQSSDGERHRFRATDEIDDDGDHMFAEDSDEPAPLAQIPQRLRLEAELLRACSLPN